MSGLILSDKKCHDLKVEKLDLRNTGKGRAGIHVSNRDGAGRFQIVKLTRCDNGLHVLAAVIGLNKSSPSNVIRLDRDLRNALGVDQSEDTVRLEIKRVGLPSTLWWFLTVRDPAVRVSAWLALTSVALGFLSVVLSLSLN